MSLSVSLPLISVASITEVVILCSGGLISPSDNLRWNFNFSLTMPSILPFLVRAKEWSREDKIEIKGLQIWEDAIKGAIDWLRKEEK
ncbi:hypothetical protein OIU79_003266 [Salix purpurea]|uniref:Uncharacterized protein n=1 Tax=Salix purpurea TaxID=77065 RepID=A0A9Q0ULE0_SALPP|nr:hypothetical protein OIU79_003266 [Salix purpurea]